MTSALFDSTTYATSLRQRENFCAPPLSVIEAAAGEWQVRRKGWVAEYPILGDVVARDDLGSAGFGHLAAATDDTSVKIGGVGGVTVFDPALAELAYSWWTRPGSKVFDPFAGGICRGLVASALGRSYLGVDIRPEQVDANESHGAKGARWVSANAATFSPPPSDFVFSCPPYGSLEVYSDDPRDLSTMAWDEFGQSYSAAIGRSVDALRPDRFAAFLVGNYKERGVLRDLASLTVEAFGRAGADLYADMVYVQPVGSAALRAAASFPTNRRPMPRHQMLLVFVKGDRKCAAKYVTEQAAS